MYNFLNAVSFSQPFIEQYKWHHQQQPEIANLHLPKGHKQAKIFI